MRYCEYCCEELVWDNNQQKWSLDPRYAAVAEGGAPLFECPNAFDGRHLPEKS